MSMSLRLAATLVVPLLTAGLAGPARGQCAADLSGDGIVNVNDLLSFLTCHPLCPDIDGDGVTGGGDLAFLILHWGPCTEDLVVGTAALEIVVVNVTDPTTAGQGLREYEVAVQFDDADDTLLTVFDAEIECDCDNGFVHSPFLSDWSPPNSLLWEALGQTYDSYVTIGVSFDDEGAVVLEPGLSSSENLLGPGAGWFQLSDGFDIGRAGSYAGLRVRVAVLTTATSTAIEGRMSASFEDAAGAPFVGDGVFALGAAPADIDADGSVGMADLLGILSSWGACASMTAPCAADIDGSGVVDLADLLLALSGWGG